jgi:hypothetical protein
MIFLSIGKRTTWSKQENDIVRTRKAMADILSRAPEKLTGSLKKTDPTMIAVMIVPAAGKEGRGV